MVALRRGFKSEGEGIAERLRNELGLPSTEPISLEKLAALLGVEIRAGDELVPRERFAELEGMQPGAFSACTLQPSADRKVIVFNPIFPKSRQASDIAHEMAHVILDHALSRIERLGDITFLSGDATQEEEANWLAGCLLLPRPLLLASTRQKMSAKEIAEAYGVSEPMAQYRLNVTGVLKQRPLRRRSNSHHDSPSVATT